MNIKHPKTDVGVIVGRFQVHELHQAHRDLIEQVMRNHQKVLIFLGLSPCKVTRQNPLDFEARKQMILSVYPSVNVLYIRDVPTDAEWSKSLDQSINDLIGPTSTVTLYGGRESFIAHYKGKHPTCELEQSVFISGSQIRQELSVGTKSSGEFRAGVIWAAHNQYPRTIPTVDVAIMDESYKRILLARKPTEDRYRFVGGFAQGGESYEIAAIREVTEETHIEMSHPTYIGSYPIDDWRYRSELDKIVTSFFQTVHLFGRPTPDDDIVELRWFDLYSVDLGGLIVREHVILLNALLAYEKEKR